MGSLYHRRFECPAFESWRRERLDPVLSRAAQKIKVLGAEACELFARCIFPDPARWFLRRPRDPESNYIQFHNWPQDRPLVIPSGSVLFSDGAGFEGTYSSLRVASWSVHLGDVNGERISSISGVVPLSEAPDQIARDGSDYAILMLSRHALIAGPSTICIDCAGTVGCL